MKKLLSIVLAMVMLAVSSVSAFALENRTTYIENGTTVTESSVEIPCLEVNGIIVSANKQRAMYSEMVGLGPNDLGPWEHGVVSGVVISRYNNPVYRHGSSAMGSRDGLVRSSIVPAGRVAQALSKTILINGNHAYWRVEK